MNIKLKIENTPILLLAMVIPFPVRVTGFIIFLITVIYLFYLFFNKKFDRNLLGNPIFILLTSSFALILLGFIWGNYNTGAMELERGLFLLCFPVIVYHSAKNSSLTLSQIGFSFFIGCFLTSLIGWVNIFWSADYSIFREGHTKFTDFLDIHPTYLSTFFAFLFFFFMESFIENYSTYVLKEKAVNGIVVVYCFFMVFFLRSQISMLCFVILLSVYFVIRLKKRAWLITFILFTIVFLAYLLDTHRVTNLFDKYGKNVSSALDDRIKLWGGVWEAIKTAPVFGAGTGDEQAMINVGYQKLGYKEGIENSYNAHNQYLQFWARNGLPELFCFFALMVSLFIRSLKLRSLAFLIFLMMVSMTMFSESFLNVQKGIVFFYFFICVFTMVPEESPILTKGVDQ